MNYDAQLNHLVVLAKTPGFKEYAWHRALQLEADDTGLWRGIAEALKRAMQATDALMAQITADGGSF